MIERKVLKCFCTVKYFYQKIYAEFMTDQRDKRIYRGRGRKNIFCVGNVDCLRTIFNGIAEYDIKVLMIVFCLQHLFPQGLQIHLIQDLVYFTAAFGNHRFCACPEMVSVYWIIHFKYSENFSDIVSYVRKRPTEICMSFGRDFRAKRRKDGMIDVLIFYKVLIPIWIDDEIPHGGEIAQHFLLQIKSSGNGYT